MNVLIENENLRAELEKLTKELEVGKNSGPLIDEDEAYQMLGVTPQDKETLTALKLS